MVVDLIVPKRDGSFVVTKEPSLCYFNGLEFQNLQKKFQNLQNMKVFGMRGDDIWRNMLIFART